MLCAGSLQAQFIMNTILEHVAKELNKDNTEVRKVNLYQKGDVREHGCLDCTWFLFLSKTQNSYFKS